MKVSPDFKPSSIVLDAGQVTVGTLFSSVAATCPNHIALSQGDRKITYDELDYNTDRFKEHLVQNGLRAGDRIAIIARNCIEYLELELAAAKGGFIVAALNWRLAQAELTHCIKLVAPKLIIAQSDYVELLHAAQIGEVPIWLIDQDLPVFHKMQDRNAFNDGHDVKIDPEDGLVILYTSGTTGLPKGAYISHRAIIARAMVFAIDLNLQKQANFIAWAPLFHMASTDHSLATLLHGGTVFIVDGYRPEELINLLEIHEQGWFVLMPGMVGDFAQLCQERNLRPKSIKACGAMADLVPAEEIASATSILGCPYVNSFGATETGLPPATGNLISIGETPSNLSKRQSTFVELKLLDPMGIEVPIGQPGEVAVRGPTLFSGYWNAGETNEVEFRDGWFHMGDVMRRNPNGTLDYVDRVKYLIKSGGENIYPAEIERVLLNDERVLEAVVVRHPDEKWGEVPVAFVVSIHPNVTGDDIVKLCRENLASYKIPKQIHFVEEQSLPRSTTGKIQRHILEKKLSS